MFKKENWQTDTIIRGIARIPIFQVHFVLCIAMLGALMCVVGFLMLGPATKTSLNEVPDGLLLMMLGFACFSLFLPMPYIVYLAKELEKTKAKVAELETNKA